MLIDNQLYVNYGMVNTQMLIQDNVSVSTSIYLNDIIY